MHEIKVGDYWRDKNTEHKVVRVDAANITTVYHFGGVEKPAYWSRKRFLECCTINAGSTMAPDVPLHAWSPDAASLAADMLSEMGYSFNGQSWVAPQIDPLGPNAHNHIGPALLTLQRLGYTWKGGTEWQPPLGQKPAFSAPDLLDRAAQHMKDRAATYDKPEGERSMAATVAAFNVQTGRDLTEAEGWLLMVNLKIVRDRQRPTAHRDSVEDLVAYGALYGEARLGDVA